MDERWLPVTYERRERGGGGLCVCMLGLGGVGERQMQTGSKTS